MRNNEHYHPVYSYFITKYTNPLVQSVFYDSKLSWRSPEAEIYERRNNHLKGIINQSNRNRSLPCTILILHTYIFPTNWYRIDCSKGLLPSNLLYCMKTANLPALDASASKFHECEDSWTLIDGYCYKMKYKEVNKTFQELKEQCDQSGASISNTIPFFLEKGFITNDGDKSYIVLNSGTKCCVLYTLIKVCYESKLLNTSDDEENKGYSACNIWDKQNFQCNQTQGNFICMRPAKEANVDKVDHSSIFACNNTSYISSKYVCDGINHCHNGTDEKPCDCHGYGVQSISAHHCQLKCHPMNCTCGHLFHQSEQGCLSYQFSASLLKAIPERKNTPSCEALQEEDCFPCTPETTEFYPHHLLCIYERMCSEMSHSESLQIVKL